MTCPKINDNCMGGDFRYFLQRQAVDLYYQAITCAQPGKLVLPVSVSTDSFFIYGNQFTLLGTPKGSGIP